VDAVYIATPHTTHYEYAKAALMNGKHVLCEKPMALKESEARELFELAASKNLILMEAVKTAYCPGFMKLFSLSVGGPLGTVKDVQASFTKLMKPEGREFDPAMAGGSFTELGSYGLLPVVKIYGHDYKEIQFTSVVDSKGIDLYTKADIYYEKGMATVKVGLGVKTEGALTISGTHGYLLAPSPWWLTKRFDVCYENTEENESFFYKFRGQGLRYEIGALVSLINGHHKYVNALTAEDSICMARIMEAYRTAREEGKVRVIEE